MFQLKLDKVAHCWEVANVDLDHRLRIYTKEKAKVVAPVYSIPCRAGYFALGRFEEKDGLHLDDMKIKDVFILFFKSSWCKIASAARNCTNFVPQTAAAAHKCLRTSTTEYNIKNCRNLSFWT